MRIGLILSVVLAGFPVGLVALAGSPLPSRLPTGVDLQAWAANPFAAPFLPGLLAAIAWFSWAFAAVLSLKIAARSAHRLSRLAQYLPGPLQGLAATLLGAAAVTATYAPAAAAPPATATATGPTLLTGTITDRAPTAGHADPTCTVHRGDTLSKIAKQRLGDPDRWPTIFKLNRGKRFPTVGGRLTNPDVIFPGWKLKMPANATPPASDTCTGPAAAPTHRPSPKPSRPADSGNTVTTPVPATAAPQAAPQTNNQTGPAVTLGIAGLTIAAGCAYAAGLLWRRKRRAAHPGDPTRPASVTLLPTTTPAGRPPTAAASGAATPAASHQPITVRPPDNPATALIGPGAHDAARAALVAVITGSIADTTALTTAATRDALLPDTPLRGGVTVVEDFAAALAALDEEIIRRSRLADDLDDGAPPKPTMLVLTDVPDNAWHGRLATAAREGERLGIDITLLGEWPSGTTLTVTADGATEAGELAVLNAGAAATLLTAAEKTTPKPATVVPMTVEPATVEPVAAPAEHPTTGRVAIRILGRPAILGPDGNPVRGLRSKSLELCVYLVLNRDGAAIDDIMEGIWPDVTVARATDRLSTCVANLRNIIRSGVRGGLPPHDGNRLEPVINTGGRYHLNPDLVDVDWWQILDAHTAAATATDDSTRLDHLREAVTVAGGRAPAADTAYEWIDTDREQARRLLIRLHLQTARLVADDNPQAARTLYETACDYDPMSEELARHAMQAAARLHDADGIRHRREQLHQALAEAGIDADTATDRHAAELLNGLTFSHQR
ncbi:Otogelin [Actinoplanes sp. SE50]|uniref:LysM peptidoglycan-binding domain-containing protein n=1 Tax=unclassified Actinoplanes TaxID=2626549 RepID=UPI00023ED22D|nr:MULTISPECIES: LysM peptidoglycan-binding domain-containing protein [unclassified Actinoplanes]AEV84403.1 Otogelin [Actinoplanes sp. SE50/110]ATO82795.1 Otogelin [Actinoplanes sp. SE50]SLM00203.1 Otogelin [Actinoplanes sp. SE50/110]